MPTPTPVHSGKVRDTYAHDDPNKLVIKASDRISVYDVVLPTLVPGKGAVLTQVTNHWLEDTPVAKLVANHLLSENPPQWVYDEGIYSQVMVAKRLKMLKVEAIVRGYLTGSGWKDYQKTRQVSGLELPSGLVEMDQFPEALFTPSTKADVGHDENIDFEGMVRILGDRALADSVRDLSLEIYEAGVIYAAERGIVLVDTKFEFGIDPDTGEITLADEVLTPDSSRYVRTEDYQRGKSPKSMDKQIVRDWASGTGWDKTHPGPELPPEVIEQTQLAYGEVAGRLTGVNPLA